jgi:hypothetical protein
LACGAFVVEGETVDFGAAFRVGLFELIGMSAMKKRRSKRRPAEKQKENLKFVL